MEPLLRYSSVLTRTQGRRFLILLLFLLPVKSFGACVLESDQQILEKISHNHPDLSTLDAQSKVYESGVDEASQAPNPILNFTTNHGSNSSSESMGNLLYVFELGGKKSSRVGVASARGDLGKLQSKNRAEEILIQSSLLISRLKQVSTLVSLYEESLQVFIKMRRSLKKNRQLSPEQRIQLDIVDMEVSKHRLKISDLRVEKAKLNNLISFYTGTDCQIRLSHKASPLEDPKEMDFSQAKTNELREMEFETRWTQQKVSFEQSRVYPDLKIGPSFQIEDERGQRVERLGLSLKMDLPIINWNRGGRQRARNEQRLLEAKLGFKKRENQVVVENLFSTYKTIFSTLSKIPNKDELLEKHHRIEKLFLRGLISIPSMIDGHDQLLSLMEDRDHHELLAQESYLKLHQFTGRLFEVLNLKGTL